LHFIDAGAVLGVIAGYASRIAPRSSLVVSVASFDGRLLAKRLAAGYSAGQFHNYSSEEVESFFYGLDLVGPGVSEADFRRSWCPVSRGTTATGTCWPAWAGWAMRDPDIARWTSAELRDVRRDLAITLGLSPPYSPMRVVIRTQIAAIDAELARRPDTGRSRPARPVPPGSPARRRDSGGREMSTAGQTESPGICAKATELTAKDPSGVGDAPINIADWFQAFFRASPHARLRCPVWRRRAARPGGDLAWAVQQERERVPLHRGERGCCLGQFSDPGV
jgi:hypothetical protein